jgi:glycine cleavage system aminomethyltransferase T
MVPLELAELGTRLTVAVPNGGERAATVVPKPFIDPKKEIPRA